jgi:hypothetical protein
LICTRIFDVNIESDDTVLSSLRILLETNPGEPEGLKFIFKPARLALPPWHIVDHQPTGLPCGGDGGEGGPGGTFGCSG